MKILQVNTRDIGGGAEKVAADLHRSYLRAGHDAFLAVGIQNADAPGVFRLDHNRWRNPLSRELLVLASKAAQRTSPSARTSARILRTAAEPRAALDNLLGNEGGSFPGSSHLLDDAPTPVDVVHFHNLHGEYFDLASLPEIGSRRPLFMTLHDAWLTTGHCAHSFDCNRWQIGCGSCPDLTIYPAVRRDATHRNWLRKADIMSRSRVRVAAPSRWLMDRIQRSPILAGAIETRVIPNGVDRSVFRPGNQTEAKSALGIPPNTTVLAFAAYGIRTNQWKDYSTLREAVRLVGDRAPDRVVMLAIGEAAKAEFAGQAEIRFVPYTTDGDAVASYLQAADLYVHAAKVDTFPNTVLEALSCGVPVVATRVGGIPEQIIDGVTGILAEPARAGSMADAVLSLIEDPSKRDRFALAAAEDAGRRFDLRRASAAYLDWYAETLQ